MIFSRGTVVVGDLGQNSWRLAHSTCAALGDHEPPSSKNTLERWHFALQSFVQSSMAFVARLPMRLTELPVRRRVAAPTGSRRAALPRCESLQSQSHQRRSCARGLCEEEVQLPPHAGTWHVLIAGRIRCQGLQATIVAKVAF